MTRGVHEPGAISPRLLLGRARSLIRQGVNPTARPTAGACEIPRRSGSVARRLRGVRPPGRRVSARELAPRCASPASFQTHDPPGPLSFSNPRRSAGASAGLATWLPPAKQGRRCARRGAGVPAGTAPRGVREAGCGRPGGARVHARPCPDPGELSRAAPAGRGARVSGPWSPEPESALFRVCPREPRGLPRAPCLFLCFKVLRTRIKQLTVLGHKGQVC